MFFLLVLLFSPLLSYFMSFPLLTFVLHHFLPPLLLSPTFPYPSILVYFSTFVLISMFPCFLFPSSPCPVIFVFPLLSSFPTSPLFLFLLSPYNLLLPACTSSTDGSPVGRPSLCRRRRRGNKPLLVRKRSRLRPAV